MNRMNDKWYDVTHLIPMIFLPLWKRIMCKHGWHLFDEVRSLHSHELYCDACDLTVPIEHKDIEFYKELVDTKNEEKINE